MGDYDNSDSGDDSAIHVKIDKASNDTKQNINMLTLSVIKYFDNQGPKLSACYAILWLAYLSTLGSLPRNV